MLRLARATTALLLLSTPLDAVEPDRAATTQQNADRFDLVIYGGTSAGVIAAVQARAMGQSVVLIEPGAHLGGLTSGGLGWTDSGNKAVIGGLSREFYRRVKQHYDDPAAWVHEKREANPQYRPGEDAMWTFEPHVAERIFDDLLREEKVEPLMKSPLATENAIDKEGSRITAIHLENGRTIRGHQFLDCTYEGDLMAAAGVTYAVGREVNETYGETLNGVGTRWQKHLHRFVKPVDPYVVPGDPKSGVLPGIDPAGPGKEGAADHRVQAYNYRLCITDARANQVPFAKPAGYDAREYELLLRNFEAGDDRLPLKIDMMPNRKTDVNNNCAVSTDYIGMNYDYPDGNRATRERILKAHRVYTQGLMWTLANHERVPAAIRNEMSKWGWARDEYRDSEHLPHQIYVREARRMIGDYVMTEHDCRRTKETPMPIGMGSYNMDSHNVQRYVTKDGYVQNEGDVQESPGGPYEIGYGAITPKRDECTNLLVPVALSSSHAAYGSIRMEPVFMTLGQSAATAASLARESDSAVQDVPYEALHTRLIADGQVLDYDGPYRDRVERLVDLEGIVVDDTEAEKVGTWTPSTSIGPILGTGYLHDDDAGKGEKSVVFTPEIPRAGRYTVRLLYTVNPNRATNVPVTIETAGKSTTIKVNQRTAPRGPGRVLGTLTFEAGTKGTITIGTTGTDGHVIVDGVQLVPAGGTSGDLRPPR